MKPGETKIFRPLNPHLHQIAFFLLTEQAFNVFTSALEVLTAGAEPFALRGPLLECVIRTVALQVDTAVATIAKNDIIVDLLLVIETDVTSHITVFVVAASPVFWPILNILLGYRGLPEVFLKR